MNYTKTDRNKVIEILTKAFLENRSVGFIVGNNLGFVRRIKVLMRYSFNLCEHFGLVYLSPDKTGFALVLLPHTKSFSLATVWWDLILLIRVIGLRRLKKVLHREKLIKSQHPEKAFYYLWFIGVDPLYTGNGSGSLLLTEILKEAELAQLPVYLETSDFSNVLWYQKFGFELYAEIDMGYKLYFLRKT